MRCSMSLSPILRTGATAGGAAGRCATGRSCSSGFRRADGGALRLLARICRGSNASATAPTPTRLGLRSRRAARKGAQEDLTRPVEDDAAKALRAWLREADLRSGPIFRHINRAGEVTDRRLTPESVRNLVVRLAELAQLGGSFSAHSLRSGYLSEAFDLNIPLPEAMSLSGHRTVQSAVRYYRPRDKGDSRAAHVFERHRRR